MTDVLLVYTLADPGGPGGPAPPTPRFGDPKCTLNNLKKKHQEKWENAYLTVKNARASRAHPRPQLTLPGFTCGLCFPTSAKSWKKILGPPLTNSWIASDTGKRGKGLFPGYRWKLCRGQSAKCMSAAKQREWQHVSNAHGYRSCSYVSLDIFWFCCDKERSILKAKTLI